MTNFFSIENRIVVVTGGLGQLGRQFSLSLLDQGARVAVFDALADEAHVEQRFGQRRADPNLRFYRVDVTRRDSIEAALGDLIATWGAPHGLVNNAALDSPPDAPAEENGPFETYPERSFDKIMEVNVKGVMLCCQAVGGAMAQA